MAATRTRIKLTGSGSSLDEARAATCNQIAAALSGLGFTRVESPEIAPPGTDGDELILKWNAKPDIQLRFRKYYNCHYIRTTFETNNNRNDFLAISYSSSSIMMDGKNVYITRATSTLDVYKDDGGVILAAYSPGYSPGAVAILKASIDGEPTYVYATGGNSSLYMYHDLNGCNLYTSSLYASRSFVIKTHNPILTQGSLPVGWLEGSYGLVADCGAMSRVEIDGHVYACTSFGNYGNQGSSVGFLME